MNSNFKEYKKKHFLMIAVFALLAIISLPTALKSNGKHFSEGAIAIFHDSKDTYRTYIYKEDTGQANMGFSYINAIGHGKSYKIFSSGSFDFTDGAFKAAKEFGAYDYVTIPGNDKKYSIEEFQSMFIMNGLE